MDGAEHTWPETPAELEVLQRELAAAADAAEPWTPGGAMAGPAAGLGEAGGGFCPAALRGLGVAAAFAAFPRGEGGPGRAGQTVVAAAVLWRDGEVVARHVACGASGGPYVAGLLALRCGPPLEAAVRGLRPSAGLVLVDATGRDHPRGAGLAVHLGARLGLPSIGVTNRALLASFEEPGPDGGSVTPLVLDGAVVGYAVRTRAGVHPVLAHAGWRTTPELARDLVLALAGRWRTPPPLRAARTLARAARASAAGLDGGVAGVA